MWRPIPQGTSLARDRPAALTTRCALDTGRTMLLYFAIPLALLLLALLILISVVLYLRCHMPPCDPTLKMDGKVVIVTGANAGIGYHTALDLARRGARVILACRSEERGKTAQKNIVDATGNHNVEFRQLNLSSLNSVRKFASNILETERELHVLVNNAGVYGFSDLTEDGIVETMQINYYAHFLLTNLLLPLLKKSQPSRIINLSSNLHFLGNFKRKSATSGNKLSSYCDSKFCMLLFSMELSRRLKGSGVCVNACHPGVILTNITNEDNTNFLYRFLFWCWCVMYHRTAEQGARTVVHLALCPDGQTHSGQYFVDGAVRWKSFRARSVRKAQKLWDHSMELVHCDGTV